MALMAIVAIIIVVIAVYIFTHLSGINLTQGIVLIATAVVGLLIIMGVILMLLKSITSKK
jgi:hypothetical protein